MPLVSVSYIGPRLTEKVVPDKWRCSWTRVECTGAVTAAKTAVKGVVEVLGQPCCKGPDVTLRTAISYNQSRHIGAVQSGLSSKGIKVIIVESRCRIVVSSSSSTDLSVGYPVCWEGE